MKKYIGKRIRIAVEGVGKVSGVFQGEEDNCLVIDLDDPNSEVPVYIPKGKISMFSPMEGARAEEPVLVLGCQNKKIGCPGVQFVRAASRDEVGDSDFNDFMSGCPLRQKSCKCGVFGDVASVDRRLLVKMMDRMMFGEYPRRKEKRDEG